MNYKGRLTIEEREQIGLFLAILAAPARRALENEGITTLEQLSKYSVQEILKLHGMGKSTIPKLEKVLFENNLTFK